jgi:serine/threonine-protein kinase
MAEPPAVTSFAPQQPGSSEHPGPLPRVFGRYVLFDRIGRGGMANIYLARADTALGGSRLCVLKQILTELGKDPEFERLLIAEAKLAAQLTHANVVQVFDLGREGDRLFIGMEYVEGFDLNQLLRALSKAKLALPAEFALLIIREVLRALDYAHRVKDGAGRPLGLVHRDVSPSNVLISFEGEVKLCDFGIARALSAHDGAETAAEGVTRTGPKVVGKSAYMSPEHARGDDIDARADVFAAGILLWELCAGRRLYRGSESEMLEQAQAADVPALPERGLPDHPQLQEVVTRALAADREQRFQSAHEFLRALEDYAVQARLMASQQRFGSFLTEHFGHEIVTLRREREIAARAYQSQIPPAEVPVLGAEPTDDSPTTVGDPTEVAATSELELSANTRMRLWSEPGALGQPPKPLDSGIIALQEPGSDDPVRGRALVSSSVSDAELERSLRGLELLAEQTKEATSAPPVAEPPKPIASPQGSREWLWYAAAAAILLLGVLGYVFR